MSFLNWIIFFFLCITWGSSFILIKKGLVSFAPEEVAVLRICISALIFLPIYRLMTKERVPNRKLGYVALAGILGNGLPAVLYATAQTNVPSSVAGILNSLSPIFVWLTGLLFFATKFKLNQFVGIIIGFAGAAAIVLLNSKFQFSFDYFTLLIVIATVCYGFSANVVKTYLQEVNAIALSAMALFLIAIPACLYGVFATDIYTTIISDASSHRSLLALVVLALFGTAIANILYYRLIQETNAVFASSVAYLIPVTALGWGFLDGEALAAIHLIGMALILIGVYLLKK